MQHYVNNSIEKIKEIEKRRKRIQTQLKFFGTDWLRGMVWIELYIATTFVLFIFNFTLSSTHSRTWWKTNSKYYSVHLAFRFEFYGWNFCQSSRDNLSFWTLHEIWKHASSELYKSKAHDKILIKLQFWFWRYLTRKKRQNIQFKIINIDFVHFVIIVEYLDKGGMYMGAILSRSPNIERKICKDVNGACVDPTFISDLCRLHPIQLIKFVRLRLKDAEELLQDKTCVSKILNNQT